MKIKNKQVGLGGKWNLHLQLLAISDFANSFAVSFDLLQRNFTRRYFWPFALQSDPFAGLLV